MSSTSTTTAAVGGFLSGSGILSKGGILGGAKTIQHDILGTRASLHMDGGLADIVASTLQGEISTSISALLPERDIALLNNFESMKHGMVSPIVFGVDRLSDTFRGIVKLKLRLPGEVADLLLAPLDALSALIPYEGSIDTSLLQFMKDRSVIRSLLLMGEAELVSLFEGLDTITSKLNVSKYMNVVDRRSGSVMFPFVADKMQDIVSIKERIVVSLFADEEGEYAGILSSVVPDALLELLYVKDVVQHLSTSLTDILGAPMSVMGILEVLSLSGHGTVFDLSSIDVDVQSDRGSLGLLDGSFLNRVHAVKSTMVDDLVNWQVGTYAPLADIANQVVDIAKDKFDLVLGLSTAMPLFSLETSLLFLMKAKDLVVDHTVNKTMLLEFMLSMPISFTESLYGFIATNPILNVFEHSRFDLVPMDLREKLSLPDLTLFPGGYSLFKSVFTEMGVFANSYHQFLHSLDYTPDMLPFSVFADLTKAFLALPGDIASTFSELGACIGDDCESIANPEYVTP